MTEQQVLSLNNSSAYEFSLYYGISKYGYIETNPLTRQYFIVHPQNRKEKFEVKLDQIIGYKEIPVTSRPYAVRADIYSLPTGSNRTKKAIILGAGASFDFTYDSNSGRMPLTKDLFHAEYNSILRKYQGAFDLSSDILLYSDIEDYFQKQWAKIIRTYNVPLLRQLISTQYYIHDLFFTLSAKLSNTQKNNYLKLVALAHEYTLETHETMVPIITFNYDTLLEEALTRQLGYCFDTIHDYINFSEKNILLFKPHGSCNWIRQIKPGNLRMSTEKNNHISQLSAKIYTDKLNLHKLYNNISEQIEVLNQTNNIRHDKQAYYPALLIPYKDKDEFSMPQRHTSILRHMLSSVDEFLVIGWKGTEEHFSDMLKHSVGGKASKFTIVEPSSPAAEKFINDYKAILPNAEFSHLTDSSGGGLTFTQYIARVSNSNSHFFFK